MGHHEEQAEEASKRKSELQRSANAFQKAFKVPSISFGQDAIDALQKEISYHRTILLQIPDLEQCQTPKEFLRKLKLLYPDHSNWGWAIASVLLLLQKPFSPNILGFGGLKKRDVAAANARSSRSDSDSTIGNDFFRSNSTVSTVEI